MRARFEKISDDPQRSFLVLDRRVKSFDGSWHFHPEVELTLIVKSRGRRFVGDSIESFVEGDLVLLGPNLPHFWRSEGPAPTDGLVHSVVVQFKRDFLGEAIWTRPELVPIGRLLERAGRGLHFTGKTARGAAAVLRELAQAEGVEALARLLVLLGKLATDRRARPLASLTYAPVLNRQTEARVARVYEYAARHFQEAVTLPQLAKAAAMSPAAFSRYFKRTTGRAPSDFLNDLRLDHACRLLRETNLTVTRIGAEAGFATLTSFNRRFRERSRTTPRDYRRMFAEPKG